MTNALQLDLGPILDHFAALEERFARLESAVAPLVEQKRWLSISEAAARLGLHSATIRRAIKRGDIEARSVGRRVLVLLPASAGAR
jgi:excisionase family DNA binding protein